MVEPESVPTSPAAVPAVASWQPSSLGLMALLLGVADLAIVVLTGLAILPPRDTGAERHLVVICAALMQLDLFRALDLYRPRLLGSPWGQAWRVGLAWSAIVLLLAVVAHGLGITGDLSASLFRLWFLAGLACLLPLHAGLARLVAAAWAKGRLTNRIVLVGAGPQAVHLLQHVRRGDPALRILGIFDERRTRLPPSIEDCPILGDLDALFAFVRQERVDQVIITLPQNAATRRLACLEKLRGLPIHVRLCPDLSALETSPRGITDLAGLPLLKVYDRPLAGWPGLVKRLEDQLLAGCLLVLLGPLMLMTALAIRLESRGPALYRQERYGFDNRPIRVLKFRTMFVERCDPPDGAVTPAKRRDPRVTPLGRILRSTSIDELPQLINVLRGEMSLVGPRPHASRQNEQFANLIDGYLARHRVKPGITGWAQIHGLRGEVDTLAKMQERVRYDLFYIENWSLQLDLRIILRTFLVGFSHPNAY